MGKGDKMKYQVNHLDKAAKLEREFVKIIIKKCKEQGLLKGEFAALVWPYASKTVSRVKWTTVRRKAGNTGKPQILTLPDAYRMAQAVNENLFVLLGAALLEVEEEENKRDNKNA